MKRGLKSTLIVLGIVLFGFSASAHKSKTPVVPIGSSVYVVADSDFSTYVAAAILANKVPLVVTMDQSKATYLLEGSAEGSGISGVDSSRTTHSVFGIIHVDHFSGKKDNSAALVLVDAKTQNVVWGGDIGAGRLNEVANRLAKALKKSLF